MAVNFTKNNTNESAVSRYRYIKTDVIDSLYPGMSDIQIEVLQTYLDTRLDDYQLLNRGVISNDDEQICRVAHRLKSNLALFGAQLGMDLCLQLEMMQIITPEARHNAYIKLVILEKNIELELRQFIQTLKLRVDS